MLNELYQKAIAAKDNAYAAYSNFHVGACIRTNSGSTFTGCNVENASYGLTICAEGGAIMQMIVNGEHDIAEIAIVSSGADFCYPCGACRQRIAEFATTETLIHCYNGEGEHQSFNMQALLPASFSLTSTD